MSLCYYTITPQPEKSPVSFIFRLFVEKNDEPTILETKNFPNWHDEYDCQSKC